MGDNRKLTHRDFLKASLTSLRGLILATRGDFFFPSLDPFTMNFTTHHV